MTQEASCRVFSFDGEWITAHLHQAVAFLQDKTAFSPGEKVVADFSGLEALDTSGAYLVEDFCQKARSQGASLSLKGLSSAHRTLLKQVRQKVSVSKAPETKTPPEAFLFLRTLGKQTLHLGQEFLLLLSFLGEVAIGFMRLIQKPATLKGTAVASHIDKAGFQALPIVGLISFLIGVVLVYQGAQQLQRFGAEIFTIDLLVVSVLREIGILLTAIVVAGRSGSAFTAQIGTMSLNQEIDAMRVIGLDPIQYLVIPRVLGLLIALPLLGFFANIMALLGGAVMGRSLLGLDLTQFMQHLILAVTPWTFWTGMMKAPVFAFVIALVGCFEGMSVTGGAERVGRHTTRSVVKSIFLVIVLDAGFSILYSILGI